MTFTSSTSCLTSIQICNSHQLWTGVSTPTVVGIYNTPPASPTLEVPPQEQLLGGGGRCSYFPPTQDVKDAHAGPGPSDNPQEH